MSLPQYNDFLSVAGLAPDDRSLIWCEQHGVGYFPVDLAHFPYNENYMVKYLEYESTKLGREITDFRVGLVNQFIGDESLIDIGIGSGAFLKARPNTYGYDINRAAIGWMAKNGRMVEPLRGLIVNASFWDSLEHMPDPRGFVINRHTVFVSLPIFEGLHHVLGSRHFRPHEHFWYWTAIGLKAWFERLGFTCLYEGKSETELGREDIGTFVFRKRGL